MKHKGCQRNVRLLFLLFLIIAGCGKEETLKVVDKKRVVEIKSFSNEPGPLTLPSLKWLGDEEILFIKDGDIWKTDLNGKSQEIIDMESLIYPIKEEIMGKKYTYYVGGERVETSLISGKEDRFVSIVLSPDGEKIAFSAYVFNRIRRTDLVVGTIDTDGQNLRLFRKENSIVPFCTNDRLPTGAPSWSSDGEKIAFHKCSGSSEKGKNVEYGIWIMEADGRNSRPFLSPGDYTYPFWSQDGKTILCKKYQWGDFREESEKDMLCTLEIVEFDSKKKKFTYSPNNPVIGPAILSPDGRWIVYTSEDTLWIIRTNKESKPIQLISYDTGKVRSEPAWSSDGKRIACVMQTRDYPEDNLWILTVEEER